MGLGLARAGEGEGDVAICKLPALMTTTESYCPE